MMGQTVRTTYVALISLYLLVMIWVWSGVFYYTGLEYANLAAILAASFSITAALFYFFVLPALRPLAEIRIALSTGLVEAGLVGTMLVLAVFHWIAIGYIPIISAFMTGDIFEAALIREGIQHTGIPLVGYIPTIIIKAGIPALLIYYIKEKRHTFLWTVMLFGLFYGLTLMQKSYPLFMLVPPVLFCVLTGRFVRGGAILAIAVIAVGIAFLAANPPLRPTLSTLGIGSQRQAAIDPSLRTSATHQAGEQPGTPAMRGLAKEPGASSESAEGQAQSSGNEDDELQTGEKKSPSVTTILTRAVDGLSRRVVYTPGHVVAKWFEVFPSVFPFEKGCGYRFVAPFVGCSFKPNAETVYALYYPKYVAKGHQGSLNASHFAEEYANFGPLGLLLSGFLVAGVLAVAALASARAGLAAAVPINFPFLMAIGSTALHTTLLSGGWGLMLLLTVIFYSPSTGKRAIGSGVRSAVPG